MKTQSFGVVKDTIRRTYLFKEKVEKVTAQYKTRFCGSVLSYVRTEI